MVVVVVLVVVVVVIVVIMVMMKMMVVVVVVVTRRRSSARSRARETGLGRLSGGWRRAWRERSSFCLAARSVAPHTQWQISVLNTFPTRTASSSDLPLAKGAGVTNARTYRACCPAHPMCETPQQIELFEEPILRFE
eukprot:6190635-Pleurochrysis_carterae.AAC.1